MVKTAVLLTLLSCLCAQAQRALSPPFLANLRPPAASGPTLKDSLTGSLTGNLECAHFLGTSYVGVDFTAGSSYTLSQLKLSLSKTGSRASGLKVSIYSVTTGGFPDPTPNAIIAGTATVTVPDASIGTSPGVVTITGFNCAIVSGTTYFFHFQDLNGSGTGDWFKMHQVGGGTGRANCISSDNSSWGSNSTFDQLWFESYQ